MKHHLADLLDRSDNYWSMTPNRERFVYYIKNQNADKNSIKIVTISKDDNNWQEVGSYPNLEELTLHAPTIDQVQILQELPHLKRLRITFYRTKDINFIARLTDLKEVILEYVSGFSDLSPFESLPELQSLHLENLRKVASFEGLKSLSKLPYLNIGGTLDWNQPITDFTFLAGLRNFEVFSLGFVNNKSDFPALLPILELEKLKKISIGRATFPTKEYAFLKTALPKCAGIDWELYWDYGDKFEFLGKGAGYLKKNAASAKERCEAFEAQFSKMLVESQVTITNHRNSMKA